MYFAVVSALVKGSALSMESQPTAGGVWSAAQIQKVSPQSLLMAGNTSPSLKKRRLPCAGVYNHAVRGQGSFAATRPTPQYGW